MKIKIENCNKNTTELSNKQIELQKLKEDIESNNKNFDLKQEQYQDVKNQIKIKKLRLEQLNNDLKVKDEILDQKVKKLSLKNIEFNSY